MFARACSAGGGRLDLILDHYVHKKKPKGRLAKYIRLAAYQGSGPGTMCSSTSGF